jgi:hypothetical protein
MMVLAAIALPRHPFQHMLYAAGERRIDALIADNIGFIAPHH